jgi:ABC-type transporter Mla maintaining outer membrane lipid asymmetry ATPase subunit MlaF
MMRELNVELRDLGRTFENTHVFSHIDLEVAKGEAAAIMGPSGLGKTTLLRIIGTLDVPTRGEVKICGEDVLSMDKVRAGRPTLGAHRLQLPGAHPPAGPVGAGQRAPPMLPTDQGREA